MKKLFNFALYDFANSSFTTIIITFIFATYFAKQIAPNPVLGQSYWGWTIGTTGIIVAIVVDKARSLILTSLYLHIRSTIIISDNTDNRSFLF